MVELSDEVRELLKSDERFSRLVLKLSEISKGDKETYQIIMSILQRLASASSVEEFEGLFQQYQEMLALAQSDIESQD